MNILLISDAYPPEIRSASRLMYEFADEMNRRGHKITVLTAYPKYNIANGSKKDFQVVENENGVRVIRIRTLDIHLVGMIRRGIGILSLPIFFYQAGKRHIGTQIDAIVVYSPPLPLALAGHFFANRFGAIIRVKNIRRL